MIVQRALDEQVPLPNFSTASLETFVPIVTETLKRADAAGSRLCRMRHPLNGIESTD
jgi:hypothetical protein